MKSKIISELKKSGLEGFSHLTPPRSLLAFVDSIICNAPNSFIGASLKETGEKKVDICNP